MMTVKPASDTGQATTLMSVLLRQRRRRLMQEALLLLVGLSVLAAGLGILFLIGAISIIGLTGAVGMIGLWPLWQQRSVLTLNNLAAHLNRQYPELEESAQLLLLPTESLAVLQQLQQHKIAQRLLLLQQNQQGQSLSQMMPPWRYHWSLALLLLALGCVWFGAWVIPLLASKPSSQIAESAESREASALPLLSMTVRVEPPAYTGLPAQRFNHGDIELLAGSKVQWQLL
jgi:hypothetical protein